MKTQSAVFPEDWSRNRKADTLSWETPGGQERNQLAGLLVATAVAKAPPLWKNHCTQFYPRVQLTGRPTKDDGGRTALTDPLLKSSPRTLPSQAGAQELEVLGKAPSQYIEFLPERTGDQDLLSRIGWGHAGNTQIQSISMPPMPALMFNRIFLWAFSKFSLR